jgi:hypothetical protein
MSGVLLISADSYGSSKKNEGGAKTQPMAAACQNSVGVQYNSPSLIMKLCFDSEISKGHYSSASPSRPAAQVLLHPLNN